jgi:hypothetical protein
VPMGTVQEATITLGEASRRANTTVETLLALIYDGRLPAVPEASTGRLLVKSSDLAELSRT